MLRRLRAAFKAFRKPQLVERVHLDYPNLTNLYRQ